MQVKNVGATSRWYAGSGINRHVWLIQTNAIHIAHWGTFIATPQVNTSSATVNIRMKCRMKQVYHQL